MNIKKFHNVLDKHLLESLSNELIRRQRINEFTTKLFDALKKTTKKSIS